MRLTELRVDNRNKIKITFSPGNMLVWLVDRLLEAEAAGEKVHILSHVPPGNAECLGAWGREYSRIITRYESSHVSLCYLSCLKCHVMSCHVS